MFRSVDFKILFHFASAEGNSTCQCRILGSKERKPGSAQAVAEQWSGGCGLQGQCTDGLNGYLHAKSTPQPPIGMRAPPECISLHDAYLLFHVFACLVPFGKSKVPR